MKSTSPPEISYVFTWKRGWGKWTRARKQLTSHTYNELCFWYQIRDIPLNPGYITPPPPSSNFANTPELWLFYQLLGIMLQVQFKLQQLITVHFL